MKQKLFIIVCCMYSLFCEAIVIRHDKDDILYRELAEKYTYSIAYFDFCVATVIESKWLITASHCVNPASSAPLYITFLGKKYAVDEIIVHPDAIDSEQLDIALLKLRWELKDAIPVDLYNQGDELGQGVTFVGNGMFGNGETGEKILDNITRAATNTVTKVEKNWLSFNFDSPGKATPLEGVSGTQDSGGPALIETNQKLYIAGVGCCQQPVVAASGIELQGGYQSTEYYSRVSTHAKWITEKIAETLTKKTLSHPILSALRNQQYELANALLKNAKTWLNHPKLIEEMLLITIYDGQLQFASELFKTYPELLQHKVYGLPLPAYAFKHGSGKYFKLLVDLGADLSFKGFMEQKYLSLLTWQYVHNDYPQLLSLLLEKGFDINEQDKRGDTAIHMAGFLGQADRLRLLVQKGADINQGDHKGITVLMDMARKGNLSLVRLLLSLGADRDVKDKSGKTAFMMAKDNKHMEVAALLSAKI